MQYSVCPLYSTLDRPLSDMPVLVIHSPYFNVADTAASGFVTLGNVRRFTSIFAVTLSFTGVNCVLMPLSGTAGTCGY